MWAFVLLIVSLLLLGCLYVVLSQENKNKANDKASDSCRVLSTRTLEDGSLLEIVDDACKEGLPHTTTSTTIRMTQSVADSSRFGEILVHERVHLDQKTRPAVWKDLVKRVWAYDLYESPPPGVPAEWVEKRRPNPDTDALPWAVWRGRYVFFAAYGDDRRLKTATPVIWDLEEGRRLENVPEWQSQFCAGNSCPHQWEHPYEIAAEYKTHASQSPAAAALFTALPQTDGLKKLTQKNHPQ
jgi:hypothetical protein